MSFDNLKSLHGEYVRLAEEVHGTEPNSVARAKAMEAKKQAYAKWNDARLAQEKSAPAVTVPAGMALRSGTTTPMAAVTIAGRGGKPGMPSTASPATPEPGK